MQHRLLSPSERLKMVQERLPIWRLLLQVTRLLHAEYLPDGNYGEDLQLLYISMVVAVGDLEDRPMSTNKIAAYLSITRMTAQRRLDRLTELGYVWRDTTGYRLARGATLAHTQHIPQAWRQIATAYNRLPKMHTIISGAITDKK